MKKLEKLVAGAILVGSLLGGCCHVNELGEGMEPYYKYVHPYLKKEGHTRPEDMIHEISEYMRNAYPTK